MRLGADGSAAINQDSRDQILRDIQHGHELQAAAAKRAATVPAGRLTPFGADQAAYEAAVNGVNTSSATVTALEKRLTASPGPYWNEMTPAEKEELALWLESLSQLDAITSKYYPSPFEMDLKKGILLAIGVGAFVAPLLFTESSDEGFPFRVLPKPPHLPDRAPMELPAPVRTAAPALTMRPRPEVEPVAAVTYQPQGALPSSVPSVASRPGYSPPPRFSRGFSSNPSAPSAPSSGPSSTISVTASRIPTRPDTGERRYIYPKPK